jgi:hypothetical protein
VFAQQIQHMMPEEVFANHLADATNSSTLREFVRPVLTENFLMLLDTTVSEKLTNAEETKFGELNCLAMHASLVVQTKFQTKETPLVFQNHLSTVDVSPEDLWMDMHASLVDQMRSKIQTT